MAYQVLAQKYRPQAFEDVVGQEAVTRTLKNSILNGRVANAYIFCGPRGVGKTSVARLLSKTLNCEKPPEESPCNKCSSCMEIASGNNIDVLEIDGASNRGIDEIRTLRENVKFSPSKSKFKIYIIDEVHMLTQEAFNALLKTLEEPPAHVKFMFATTEPHKVLPTIMSRCQRFDFKKIPPKKILERINDIAEKEKIDIDEKAALLIARSADGSLRDSQVILDQMISFSGKKISSDDVVELLGMVHKDRIFELTDAVIGNDPKNVALNLDELINSGKDPVFIVNSLIGHFRDLMILKTAGTPTADMAFASDELEKIKAQLEKLSLEEILYVLQNLSHCRILMKGAVFARAPLEIALIRLTKRQSILALPDIISKLEGIKDTQTGAAAFTPSPETPGKETFSGAPVEIKEKQKENMSAANAGAWEDSADIEENGSENMGFQTQEAQWKAVLNYIRKKRMSVFTFLNPAKPLEFNKKKVTIGFSKEYTFNKDALATGTNKSMIEEALEKVTGSLPKLEFTIQESPGEDTTEIKNAEYADKKNKAKEEMKPVIEKAMDVFGGHVVRDIMEDGR